ncbi:MAG: type II 3-dehydroquinate dehydratase [Coriobacteriia bacterium]|nr:type II 3-dehydroquinate dehydratase [Coriobacteriia bacterium]
MIRIINGPNLNLLGKRKPELYGYTSLKDLESELQNYAEVECFQTNHEGEIIDLIQNTTSPIVLNPGAYGHYSYAIRDAIEAIKFPVIEVHITDVNAREEFRSKLVLSDVCSRTIIGHGIRGYFEAIDILKEKL